MRLRLIEGNTAQAVYGESFDKGLRYTNWRPRGSGDCLLLLTLAGAGRVGNSARQHRIAAGEAVLFEVNAEQVYYTDPQEGRWKFVWAHFLPRPHWFYGRAWARLEPGLLHLPVLRPGPLRAARGAMEEMVRWVRQPGALGRDFALNALERALLWMEQEAVAGSSPGLDPRVQAAAEWLVREVARPFDLAAAAGQAGLSVSRLAHLFRAQMGRSPRAYAEEQKMRHAAQLLRITSSSVEEVAAACGYADAFYFSTRFRRWAKLSPRAFRLKLSQEPNPAQKHQGPARPGGAVRGGGRPGALGGRGS